MTEEGKKMMHFFRRWGIVVVAIVVSIAIGKFFSHYSYGVLDQNMRDELLSRAQTIALMTNSADIASLKGTEEDINTPAYHRIKQSLYNLHNVNTGSRFVYYQRSNGTKLVFLADSEPPTSEDYSPPGQVYEDTSKLEFDNYQTATPFVEGPYSDEWGRWISAYAPVWNNGELAGIVGIDVSADKWQQEANIFGSMIMLITLLAICIAVLIGVHYEHNMHYKDKLKKLNEYVLKKEKDC